ncbi:hypothetical protein, partial [Enterobacter intestinihominis]
GNSGIGPGSGGRMVLLGFGIKQNFKQNKIFNASRPQQTLQKKIYNKLIRHLIFYRGFFLATHIILKKKKPCPPPKKI